MTIFDIETGPLADEDLVAILPPGPADAGIPDPAPFDEASVAVGNLKDPAKIEAKIATARDAHATEVATLDQRREAARGKRLRDFADRAALAATTGRVRVVGFRLRCRQSDERTFVLDDSEGEAILLDATWATLDEARENKESLVGFHIFGFDLPFLVRRSWILGVAVPAWLRAGRYWAPQFVDLLDVWALGRPGERISLDELARACTTGHKPHDVTGADFARLFDGTPDERRQALDYLENDLALTAAVAEALGVL